MQSIAGIAQANACPSALASRSMNPILFGPAHPYGQLGDGLGDVTSVTALTPASLRAAQAKWLRPDNLTITVVGDVSMEQLLPMLERSFGTWQSPAGPRGVKSLTAAVPAPRPPHPAPHVRSRSVRALAAPPVPNFISARRPRPA